MRTRKSITTTKMKKTTMVTKLKSFCVCDVSNGDNDDDDIHGLRKEKKKPRTAVSDGNDIVLGRKRMSTTTMTMTTATTKTTTTTIKTLATRTQVW